SREVKDPTGKLLTILIPAFNEEESLPLVFPRLTQSINTLPGHIDYEVIDLDSVSTDRTPIIAREFCERDRRWKWLRYSRSFGVNAILCFSAKPLRLATVLGGFVAAAAFAYALFAFAVHFLHLSFMPIPPPGITTIILLVSFFIGFNTMFLGIIGEYLGRIYNQGKNRPLYLVDEQVNFDETVKNRRGPSAQRRFAESADVSRADAEQGARLV